MGVGIVFVFAAAGWNVWVVELLTRVALDYYAKSFGRHGQCGFEARQVK
jgi:hypothetical protein